MVFLQRASSFTGENRLFLHTKSRIQFEMCIRNSKEPVEINQIDLKCTLKTSIFHYTYSQYLCKPTQSCYCSYLWIDITHQSLSDTFQYNFNVFFKEKKSLESKRFTEITQFH